MAKPDGERVAALEATIVAFEKNQQALEHKVDAGFTSMNAKLDALDSKISVFHNETDNRFVTRVEFDKKVRATDDALSRRLWQSNLLTSAVTAIIISLVWYIILSGLQK